MPLDMKRRPFSFEVVAHASSTHLEHGQFAHVDRQAVTSWMTVTVMAPGTLCFVPVGPRGDAADEK